jgi:hypothetical protein
MADRRGYSPSRASAYEYAGAPGPSRPRSGSANPAPPNSTQCDSDRGIAAGAGPADGDAVTRSGVAGGGRSGTVTPVSSYPASAEPVLGNVMAGLSGMLASMGLAPAASRDTVTDIVSTELVRRGHVAEVTRLQYGTLHLAADPQAARLLRYDVDALLGAIDAVQPGAVRSISVRVARPH